MSFLAKISSEALTDEELLEQSISGLPPEEIMELAYSEGIADRPGLIDEMQAKIASVSRVGKALAHEHGAELEKIAILGALMGAGRAVGGLGMVKSIGKDLAVGASVNGVGKAVSKAQHGFESAAPGVLKQAGVLPVASIGQKLVGGALRRPDLAMAAGGAALGAATADRDPQTGEKKWLSGAAMGGALGYGASKIPMLRSSPKSTLGIAPAGGNVGSALRKGIVGKQQILGPEAAAYGRNALQATRPGAGRAAKATARAAKTPGGAAAAAGGGGFEGALQKQHTPPVAGGAVAPGNSPVYDAKWNQALPGAGAGFEGALAQGGGHIPAAPAAAGPSMSGSRLAGPPPAAPPNVPAAVASPTPSPAAAAAAAGQPAVVPMAASQANPQNMSSLDAHLNKLDTQWRAETGRPARGAPSGIHPGNKNLAAGTPKLPPQEDAVDKAVRLGLMNKVANAPVREALRKLAAGQIGGLPSMGGFKSSLAKVPKPSLPSLSNPKQPMLGTTPMNPLAR